MMKTGNMAMLVIAASGVVGWTAASASAQIDVIGGQTNVLLDFATLESAAGLTLAGVVGDTIAPGDLGEGSVAFPINPRNAVPLPTTFSYADGLAGFSGTIEHTGGVEFNGGAIVVGNFTIGFDALRVGGDRSGFFVESRLGIEEILFDIENPGTVSATGSGLEIGANLLVSSEFADLLETAGLALTNLTGATVGEALVVAAVPSPGAFALAGISGLAISRRRR
ncbi:MAG: hypothetical protein EA380_10575 [Phycisphaeraceae bacterium]|nr:MAG: hypothetical protein EA380_10575 [Phycisphaeraceae bacterium]